MPFGVVGAKIGTPCIDCKEPITELNAMYTSIYLLSRCKPCELKHRKTIPSRTKEVRTNYWRKWKHGITPKEYNKKLELQLGGCAICKQKCKTGRGLAVDHDHKTGKMRDLLCQRCNVVLGHIGEDEDLLFHIAVYLKRHSEKQVNSGL